MTRKTTLAVAAALAIGSGSTYLAIEKTTVEVPGLAILRDFTDAYHAQGPWTAITMDGQPAGALKGYRQDNGDSVVVAFYDPARASLRSLATHSLVVRRDGSQDFDVWVTRNPHYERIDAAGSTWALWHLTADGVADSVYGTVAVSDSCIAPGVTSTFSGEWKVGQ